jgi:AcrR family transcriptional regulator
MFAAGSSRQDRRKQRTATAILDAAEGLFLERGYLATTVEQIAARADVALGSVYGHFASKEGVYAALVDRALDLDRRYCDEGGESGSNPVERLLGLSEGYLRFAREHPGHFRIFRYPPPGGPTEGPAAAAAQRVAERIASEVERIAGEIERIAGTVGQGLAEGLGRAIDPRATAVFLWTAWDGIIAAHLPPGNMGLSEAELDTVLSILREEPMRGPAAPGEPGGCPAAGPPTGTADRPRALMGVASIWLPASATRSSPGSACAISTPASASPRFCSCTVWADAGFTGRRPSGRSPTTLACSRSTSPVSGSLRCPPPLSPSTALPTPPPTWYARSTSSG